MLLDAPDESLTEISNCVTCTQVPGLEAQKARANVITNVTRSNIVNVAPQWNTERWQRQQHQQRQQQLYAAASSVAPAVRPGICPPISVTQFYPPNYAVRNGGIEKFVQIMISSFALVHEENSISVIEFSIARGKQGPDGKLVETERFP